MKINFLLLAIIAATITSCSTSYKTGQTPDDVYYSPARLQTDNVRRVDENKKVQDNSVYTTPDDRYIRRRVHNRRYRRYDDNYNYPYGYNNGYNGYNGYPVYTNPKTNTIQNTSQPRKTNLGAYSPNTTTPDSVKAFNPKLSSQNNTAPTNPVRTFSTPVAPNNGTPVGNFIRRVFNGYSNPNNNYNNNSNNSSRTFESSNSNNNNNSNTRTFERTNNNSNTNTNTNTQSAPTTNSTSAPVRTFKKED